MVLPYHDKASVSTMGAWLNALGEGKKAKRWYLQKYTDRDSVVYSGFSAPEEETMRQYAEILAPYADLVSLRGISTKYSGFEEKKHTTYRHWEKLEI